MKCSKNAISSIKLTFKKPDLNFRVICFLRQGGYNFIYFISFIWMQFALSGGVILYFEVSDKRLEIILVF